MRFACDTGGTFTDLVVESDDGSLRLYKAETTPHDPIEGVLAALALAAAEHGSDVAGLLARGETFVHGTTHAINAIVTATTARTAFLTTEGHRDVLLLREGSRRRPFDHTLAYPKPYVPRALTFEIPGRIDAEGRELVPFDDDAAAAVVDGLAALGVEAVAVCLLWSIVEPAHELRLGTILRERLPDVPFTLSHELNPSWREYRRASSAAIDASLKPLMTSYLGGLTERLATAGFAGRVLCLTSQGGTMEAEALARTPIHAVNSGPALAPIAGAHYSRAEPDAPAHAIVADTGGTTYDVSLVRGSEIPWTRETWIGEPYLGHMTGFPSVDVRSIGAGGGSIAWVDPGGILRVGPQSAGAVPGPACYGKDGEHATITDASLVLGYLDPDYFLGGSMDLDVPAAEAAIRRDIAEPLGLGLAEAAWAVLDVATENMVQAIVGITVNRGVDPGRATLVGGGGAAGLNSVFVARRLRCPRLVIPETGAALSAAGALLSDLTSEVREVRFTRSDDFDFAAVAATLERLEARCREFVVSSGRDGRIELSVEARYASQAWEIPLALPAPRIEGGAGLAELVEAFHDAHRELFAFDDRGSVVELVSWVARASVPVRTGAFGRLHEPAVASVAHGTRTAFFSGHGELEAPVLRFEALEPGPLRPGPALVESPFTTVVVDPTARFARSPAGSLVIEP